VPFVIGVTRQDQPRVWAPADVALYFGLPEDRVLGLNATSEGDARRVLAHLLELTLNAAPAVSSAPNPGPSPLF
jgi:signal recognition particle receptor subunit beta